MGRGQWAEDNGQWAVDCGPWTVDMKQWTVEMGRRQWTISSGQCAVGRGQWTVNIQFGNIQFLHKIFFTFRIKIAKIRILSEHVSYVKFTGSLRCETSE
jgi:hypothetical protein